MQVKVITLKFDSLYGGFNDEVIQAFTKDKEIISVKEYFFIRNETPFLTLVIQYSFGHAYLESGDLRFQAKQNDWRKLLDEADLGLYDLLRNWRFKRSKQEGLPPYVLFSNIQLAKIANGSSDFY